MLPKTTTAFWSCFGSSNPTPLFISPNSVLRRELIPPAYYEIVGSASLGAIFFALAISYFLSCNLLDHLATTYQ